MTSGTVSLSQPPTALIGNQPFRSQLAEQFLARAAVVAHGRPGGLHLARLLFTNKSAHHRLHENLEHRERDHPSRYLREAFAALNFFAVPERPPTHPDQTGLIRRNRRLAPAPTEISIHDRSSEPKRPGCVWWKMALADLGGTGSLSALYSLLEGRRPTANSWWKEKTRQVLNAHPHRFERVEPGRYRLKPPHTIHPEPLFAYA